MTFEIIDHGWDNPDYFQGCGVAFTQWQHCVTGAGDTALEALEDALEQTWTHPSGIKLDLAQVEAVEGKIPDIVHPENKPSEDDSENDFALVRWVSIRWRMDK